MGAGYSCGVALLQFQRAVKAYPRLAHINLEFHLDLTNNSTNLVVVATKKGLVHYDVNSGDLTTCAVIPDYRPSGTVAIE